MKAINCIDLSVEDTLPLISDASLDITAPEEVSVELQHRMNGPVLYVNVNGICAFRACRIKAIQFKGSTEPIAIKYAVVMAMLKLRKTLVYKFYELRKSSDPTNDPLIQMVDLVIYYVDKDEPYDHCTRLIHQIMEQVRTQHFLSVEQWKQIIKVNFSGE